MSLHSCIVNKTFPIKFNLNNFVAQVMALKIMMVKQPHVHDVSHDDLPKVKMSFQHWSW